MKRSKILFGLLVATGACDMGAVGNGDVTTASRPLTGFSQVEAAGSGVVRVHEGPAFAVTITTDSNIQPLVETRVEGDTLVVGEHDVSRTTELLYEIELPTLRGATLSGSGELSLVGAADSLSASLSGSGQLDARGLPIDRAALSVSGSGGLQATVSGSVSFELDGSGDIDWWGPATVSSTAVGGSGRIAHH